MRTLSRLFLLGVILVSLGGCAALKSAFQTEPEKVEMVLLSELTFHGEISGIKGPIVFGDFTVTHNIGSFSSTGNNALDITWCPNDKENPTCFLLTVKETCPEGIALSSCNRDTEESTFWIYDREGQAWQVDKKKYDYFLTLEHPCAADMSAAADAIITI